MKANTAARDALRDTGLAVVTGGSSGIGREFIASMREARPGLRVCNLSRSVCGVEGVRDFSCDLSRPAERSRVLPEVVAWAAGAPEVGKLLLINNSGFGTYGAFPEPKTQAHLEMIELNIAALVELTGALLPELRRRGGAVINVASTAAFQPMPSMQTYAATKSFVVSWTVALAQEWRGTGVRALVLCPGPTHTNFHRRAGFDGQIAPALAQEASEVVDTAWRALSRGRAVVVSGWKNAVVARVSRLAPLTWSAFLAGRVVERTRRTRTS